MIVQRIKALSIFTITTCDENNKCYLCIMSNEVICIEAWFGNPYAAPDHGERVLFVSSPTFGKFSSSAHNEITKFTFYQDETLEVIDPNFRCSALQRKRIMQIGYCHFPILQPASNECIHIYFLCQNQKIM